MYIINVKQFQNIKWLVTVNTGNITLQIQIKKWHHHQINKAGDL